MFIIIIIYLKEKLLEDFCRPELSIKKEMCYQCQTMNYKTCRLSFSSLLDFLTIHLKRFHFDKKNEKVVKLNDL